MPVTIIREDDRSDFDARINLSGGAGGADGIAGTCRYSVDVTSSRDSDASSLSERLAECLAEAAGMGCESVLVDASDHAAGLSAETIYMAVVDAACGFSGPGEAFVCFFPGKDGFNLMDGGLAAAEAEISKIYDREFREPERKEEHPLDEDSEPGLFPCEFIECCSEAPSFPHKSFSEALNFRPSEMREEDFDLSESFSRALLRLIGEKGMTEAECYKRANVDRRVFSKIKRDAEYRPSKSTAMAFVVALRLTVDEADDLLGTAGYTLSRSLLGDVIVSWFLEHGEFDVYKINELLYSYGQPLLGFRS